MILVIVPLMEGKRSFTVAVASCNTPPAAEYPITNAPTRHINGVFITSTMISINVAIAG